MRLLHYPLVFDWDDGNLNKNLYKHDVTIQEAEQIFFNRPLYLSESIIHPASEVRHRALGKNNNGRRLLAIFTLRDNKIRIISIRDMSKKERREYENVQENS